MSLPKYSTGPSNETVARMKAQKTRDTKCEIDLRRILHSMGLRYRVHDYPLKDLRRRADIVFRASKVAVFVDGCFWHGCKQDRGPSKTNTEWWSTKIQANRRRDEDTDHKLRNAKWSVIRCWEHEDPIDVAKKIRHAVACGRK